MLTMFIAALFTTAKTWKQRKYPSTDKWKQDIVHTHTEEYSSAKRKRMKFCHLQQHGWTSRVLCLVKYVRQRKINTV